jgi:hypothetical protein
MKGTWRRARISATSSTRPPTMFHQRSHGTDDLQAVVLQDRSDVDRDQELVLDYENTLHVKNSCQFSAPQTFYNPTYNKIRALGARRRFGVRGHREELSLSFCYSSTTPNNKRKITSA